MLIELQKLKFNFENIKCLQSFHQVNPTIDTINTFHPFSESIIVFCLFFISVKYIYNKLEIEIKKVPKLKIKSVVLLIPNPFLFLQVPVSQ